MRFSVLVTIAALLASPLVLAQDAHKCKLSDGKIVYQDSPCVATGSGTVRVVRTAETGKTDNTPQNTDEKTPAQTEVARLKGILAGKEKARMISDINSEIAAQEQDIYRLQNAMQNELAALRAKKSLAKNNLAGATWEASISSEMQATTQRYNTEIATRTSRITRLREDLSKIK